jgi:hypothetical protein
MLVLPIKTSAKMKAKSVSTYDERDIIVNREREGARREPLCISVCVDLAIHIVHLCFKLCFAAASSSGHSFTTILSISYMC